MAQEFGTSKRTLSGYLCTSPGTGECESSAQGSTISPGEILNSSILGIACFLMGQSGSFLSMSEKKYGVMAIASRPFDFLKPSFSSGVSLISFCRTSKEVILFFNCHFQSGFSACSLNISGSVSGIKSSARLPAGTRCFDSGPFAGLPGGSNCSDREGSGIFILSLALKLLVPPYCAVFSLFIRTICGFRSSSMAFSYAILYLNPFLRYFQRHSTLVKSSSL